MASARSPQRILLALTACLALVAALAWSFGRRPGPEAGPAPAAGAGTPTPPVSAAAAPRETREAPEAASAAIPLTQLPLRLVATVVRKNPALSLATVENLERGANALMSEGQSFVGYPSARIARIERGRLLIDHDGVREQLLLSSDTRPLEEQAAAPVDLAPGERERRRDLSRRLRELTDAGSDYRAQAERGGLLAEGDVSAVYQDGELVGVQFDGIREGGVYEKLGLRNGDVVTDIGGVALSDPAAAAKVLGQFASSDELRISVVRPDGSPTTLSLSTATFKTLVDNLE